MDGLLARGNSDQIGEVDLSKVCQQLSVHFHNYAHKKVRVFAGDSHTISKHNRLDEEGEQIDFKLPIAKSC